MRFKDEKNLIPIWGEKIPGNRNESKNDILNIDDSLSMEDIFTKYPGVWDKSCDKLGDMKGNDTLVYRDEMQNGYAKDTYTDVPFIAPFLVEGSDKCVIICPGGAYLSKSVESEGEDVAKFLNDAGINAFVLWYRTYPYHAPLMYMDCQRAVRYVRYHADEFGINPDKIATVGFSAGGNLCGVHAISFGNTPVDYPGYEPDQIDQVNGQVNAVGMCYPAVSLIYDKALACIAGRQIYDDVEKRKAFADKYDMVLNLTQDAPPMFLCNAMDDDVLPPMNLAELAKAANEKKVPCELHIFPYGGHGFGGCIEHPSPFMKPNYSAVKNWIPLFTDWINRTLG